MAGAETLTVELRSDRGTRVARRLRRQGRTPAVLYGHGQASLGLSIPSEQVGAAVRHGARVVDLAGAVTEKAFIRELQWDPYGTHVLHLDLTRVRTDELVEVKVAVELRGQAPGVKEGGVIDQLVHEIAIECPAIAIPDKIEVSLNELALEGEITVGQLRVPENVRVLTPAGDVVVHCVRPREEVEAAAAPAGPAEPEVIGREAKAEAEEED